jgi:hypothetical protein
MGREQNAAYRLRQRVHLQYRLRAWSTVKIGGHGRGVHPSDCEFNTVRLIIPDIEF